LAEQDPDTGYWRTTHGLNMGLTFHYANMLFRHYSPKRFDQPLIRNSNFNIGVEYIPRAKKIIETTLGMQARKPNGELAAWSRSAYRFTTEPDGDDHKCDFGTTWDAIYLMRIACINPEVDDALREQVYQSIKSAFKYILENNILPDGNWLQRETYQYPTRSSYMFHLMEDSHWLEWRMNPAEISAPSGEIRDGRLHVAFLPEQTSIRVFSVPDEFDIADLDETKLIGVIQQTGHIPVEMDPFAGMKLIRDAGNTMWGISISMPDESDTSYNHYINWKIRKLPETLVYTVDSAPLDVSGVGKNCKIYITACSWYGEQSSAVYIPWPQ